MAFEWSGNFKGEGKRREPEDCAFCVLVAQIGVKNLNARDIVRVSNHMKEHNLPLWMPIEP